MLLIITYTDGSEEQFDIDGRSTLHSLRHDGYWTIRTLSGGQLAIGEEQVSRVELGRLTFQDDQGRTNADAEAEQ